MRGSVRQRARGVWEIRIYVGRDPATGRKRYKSRTVRGRRRDVEQLCRDLLSEIDAEPEVAAPAVALPTVGEWLDEWWELKKPTLSPTTVSSWRSSVERYLKPELGTTPLHEVRAVELAPGGRGLSGSNVGGGFGSDLSEQPAVQDVEPVTLDYVVVPECPPGPTFVSSWRLVGRRRRGAGRPDPRSAASTPGPLLWMTCPQQSCGRSCSALRRGSEAGRSPRCGSRG